MVNREFRVKEIFSTANLPSDTRREIRLNLQHAAKLIRDAANLISDTGGLCSKVNYMHGAHAFIELACMIGTISTYVSTRSEGFGPEGF